MKIVLLQFGARMTGRGQSLDEPKYKVLVLGGFGDCIPHREATHLTCSRRGRPTLLITATMLCIRVDRIGRTSAIK
jgi:hypothetical protein